MESPKNTNQPPFKENLVDFPAKATNIDIPEGYPVLFKQFENNPEKIVKISRKENIYRFTGENDPVESPKSFEILKKSKEHYNELNNKYNIAVTQPEYIVGMDEEGNESVVYSVSDRIHGDNLLEKIKDFKSSEDIKELENLLISLMDYFEDKFNNDNYYLGDIGNLGNYMYGCRKGEDKDRVYLVDVEPVLDGLDSPEKRNFFYSRIKEVFYPQIEYIEKETELNLSNTRKRYSDFIKNIEKKL